MNTLNKSEILRVRERYIDAEVKLLNALTGKELALLNEMIEANEEYIDLLKTN